MCDRIEVECSNTNDQTDYGHISDIVADYDRDYSYEFEVINDKLTIMAMMILRTSGYTNTFKKNPADNRKHIGKNVKELAEVFGIEFRSPYRLIVRE